MNLKTLRYFVVVAEERNITRAAKALMMSQPPLSNQMKLLEEELKTTLFLRGKRSLTLTEEGEYLYRKAKDILALTDKTVDDFLLMGQGITGTVNIGFDLSFPGEQRARWISSFQQSHPGIRFRISHDSSDALVEKMRTGLLPLAVISAPYDQVSLNAIKVGERPVNVLMKAENSLSGKEKLTMNDLANERIIVPSGKGWSDSIRRWSRNANVDLSIACETDDPKEACALVEDGLGVALFPRQELDERAALIQRPLSVPPTEFYFVWRKGHPLPTFEESFIDFIKENAVS